MESIPNQAGFVDLPKNIERKPIRINIADIMTKYIVTNKS